jgi:hypothetical protein
VTLHDVYIKRPILNLIRGLRGWSVVDLGFGYGEWGLLMRHEMPGVQLSGVESYDEYIRRQRGFGIYHSLYHDDASAFIAKHPAWDMVFCTDVIEHQPREWGLRFLDNLDKAQAKLIVLTTPCGYSRLPEGRDGNPDNRHVSGWSPADFRERGYTVYLIPLVTVPFWLRPIQTAVNFMRGGKATAEILAYKYGKKASP